MFLKQKNITDFLERFFNDSNFSEQSLLFWGEPMMGKLTTAKLFAQSVLCPSSKKWQECQNSPCCRMLKQGLHPDFQLLEPEKGTLKIEQIRQGIKFLSYRPQLSSKRVLIINKADMMTRDAQNSFLKTLEEPPEQTIIILIATSPFSLLSTIRSRLLPLRFSRFSDQKIEGFLKTNSALSQNDIQQITQIADGKIGLACRLTDKKYRESVFQAEKDLTALIKGNFVYQSHYFTSLTKTKKKLLPLITLWLRLLRRAIIYHSIDIPLSPDHQTRLAKRLISSYYYLKKTNSSAQLLMENIFLTYDFTASKTNSRIS